MPSTLSWVDFDSEAQQRTHRILKQFDARDTRDELGLGSIRDAISDSLFPGTSVLHTRLRYMLLVPWTYLALEKKQVRSSKIQDLARSRQLDVAKFLKKNVTDEGLGVIGGSVGDKLKTLPSAIYWSGMQRWGIRAYPGTEYHYQQALDETYRRRKRSQAHLANALEDGDDIGGMWTKHAHTFHPGLPTAPEDFPDSATFDLIPEEATYLQSRVNECCSGTLLAHLLSNPLPVDIDSPWNHPNLAEFSGMHQALLRHAEHFSFAALGASLVYNQLLAKKKGNDEWIEAHRQGGTNWTDELDRKFKAFSKWAGDLQPFWESLEGLNHQIDDHTRDFVSEWTREVLQHPNDIFTQSAVQTLIKDREINKKLQNSRFRNDRVLEQWGGGSGLNRMTYRWSLVQTYITDMARGLGASS